MRRGSVQDAVGGGLGRDVVVAGHDDVEVVRRERGEAAQGAIDRGAAVARQHADREAVRAQATDELLGALVGLGGVGGVQLEALEDAPPPHRARLPPAGLDPLEHEAVRRAADLALDGREVERAGARQGAVEIEEDRPQAERTALPPRPARGLSPRTP